MKNQESQNQDSFLGEIIGGVVAGIFAIAAIILLILFLKQRQKQSDVEIASDLHRKKSEIQEEKIPLEDSQTQKVALLPAAASMNTTATSTEAATTQDQFEEEEEDSKPKFASPIWLEEIHANKIFNRQKSLLSEDKLNKLVEQQNNDDGDDDSDDLPLPPPPPLPEMVEEEEQVNLLTNGDHHNSVPDYDEDEVWKDFINRKKEILANSMQHNTYLA